MKTILCFGDSNTYGLIPGTKERYPEDIRWTGILGQRLKNRGFRVVEEGLVGRTTIFPDNLRPGRDGSELLPVLLESHYPVDELILMLGTNDCTPELGLSPEQIAGGMEKLITLTEQESPGLQGYIPEIIVTVPAAVSIPGTLLQDRRFREILKSHEVYVHKLELYRNPHLIVCKLSCVVNHKTLLFQIAAFSDYQ